MKRITVGLMACALAVTVAAIPAAAQPARAYIGIGGGLAIPVGDYGESFKTGWDIDVLAGFTNKGGIWGFRADAMWAQNNLKAGVSGHERLLGLNGDIVLTPGHRPANWHPYVLLGVGFYNAKETAAGVTGSDTKFAFNGGAGVQIHTGHRTDVFVEGRFISVREGGGGLNFIPINVGFRWGGI